MVSAPIKTCPQIKMQNKYTYTVYATHYVSTFTVCFVTNVVPEIFDLSLLNKEQSSKQNVT